MALFSGSQIDRVAACPYSESIPHAYTTSPYALSGTTIHSYLEKIALGQTTEKALSEIEDDEIRRKCSKIDVKSILARFSSYESEVASAWNWETNEVRRLSRIWHRNYETGLTEIPATIDLAGTLRNGMSAILDYKTGANIGDIRERWQFRFAAMCWMIQTSTPKCRAIVVYFDDNGVPSYEHTDFTAQDVETFGIGLKKIVEAVFDAQISGKAVPIPGVHCKYCPGFSSCSYQSTLLRNAFSTLTKTSEQVDVMSPGELANLWGNVQEMDKLLSHVKSVIKTAVDNYGPLPTKNGKALQMSTRPYSFFDTKGALKLLKKSGVPEDQIEKLYKTANTSPFVKEMKITKGVKAHGDD